MRAEIDSGLIMDPVDVNTFDIMDRQNAAFQPEISDQAADNAAERALQASKEQARLNPAPKNTSVDK